MEASAGVARGTSMGSGDVFSWARPLAGYGVSRPDMNERMVSIVSFAA